MLLKKELIPPFIVHGIALIIYTFFFLINENYEFMIYIGVIIAVMLLVMYTDKKVNYSADLVWGLSIWSILHMSGAGLYFAGIKLYDTMLINIIGSPYNILKYDQVVHIFGFYVATILMFTILRPCLKDKIKKWSAISIVIIMAGMGAGALNEIIEFFATVILPQTGVGGYVNTGLDLVSNAIGSVLAMIVIVKKESKKLK